MNPPTHKQTKAEVSPEDIVEAIKVGMAHERSTGSSRKAPVYVTIGITTILQIVGWSIGLGKMQMSVTYIDKIQAQHIATISELAKSVQTLRETVAVLQTRVGMESARMDVIEEIQGYQLPKGKGKR